MYSTLTQCYVMTGVTYNTTSMFSVKGIAVGVLVCYILLDTSNYHTESISNHNDDEETLVSVITFVILTRISAKAKAGYIFLKLCQIPIYKTLYIYCK